MVSCVKRTGTIFPLASRLGNFGRPTFLALGIVSVLLNDGRSHGGLWRFDWRNMQHGYMPLRFYWIVCFMCPSVNLVCSSVAVDIENLYVAFPHRLPLKCLL